MLSLLFSLPASFIILMVAGGALLNKAITDEECDARKSSINDPQPGSKKYSLNLNGSF